MSFERMLNGTAEYRSFLGDGADRGYVAEYEAFDLSSVMIREKTATDPENKRGGETLLYFFPAVSKCTDRNGETTGLPPFKHGDTCVIPTGNGERVMRVAEAGYFDDVSDGRSHVRLKLV